MGTVSISVHAASRQIQMAGTAAYGEHLGPLESRQDQRSAVRILQWSWLGELGKYLGHMERDHSSRRRGHSASRNDRARSGKVSGQPGLGADVPDVAVWRLCQPLAARRSDTVDDREPQRVQRTG